MCFCRIFIAMAIVLASWAAFAVDYPDAAKLRTHLGSSGKILKCSPEGGNGYMSPLEAFSKAKRGDTIRFAPGSYSGAIDINVDKLVLERDNDAQTEDTCLSLSFNVSGSDCVVRNLRILNLDIRNSVSVVDCEIMNMVVSSTDPKKNGRINIANSLISSVQIYPLPNDLSAMFKNCLFYSNRRCNDNMPSCSDAAFYVNSSEYKMNIEIVKCVFVSSTCMSIPGTMQQMSKVGISLQDTIFSATDSIVRLNNVEDGKKGSVIRAVKEMKKLKGLTIKGRTELARAEFTDEDKIKEGSIYYRERAVKSFRPDYYAYSLAQRSPGRAFGAGLSVTDEGYLGGEIAVADASKKPPVAPVQPGAEEKRAKEAVSEQPAKKETDSANGIDLAKPDSPASEKVKKTGIAAEPSKNEAPARNAQPGTGEKDVLDFLDGK